MYLDDVKECVEYFPHLEALLLHVAKENPPPRIEITHLMSGSKQSTFRFEGSSSLLDVLKATSDVKLRLIVLQGLSKDVINCLGVKNSEQSAQKRQRKIRRLTSISRTSSTLTLSFSPSTWPTRNRRMTNPNCLYTTGSLVVLENPT